VGYLINPADYAYVAYLVSCLTKQKNKYLHHSYLNDTLKSMV